MKLQPFSDYSDYEERLLNVQDLDIFEHLGVRRLDL